MISRQRKRGYFVAIFGDPIGPPAKDRVEGGRYIPYEGWINLEHADKCDFMLLYCAGSYGQYYMEAPGIGVIINVELPSIYYCYLPLDKPIPLNTIRSLCTSVDKVQFANLHGKTLFAIERTSFRSILAGCQINWP